MKNLLWIGPALALAACTGDDTHPGKNGDKDPCEIEGNICTWMGRVGIGGAAPEGLKRTDGHQLLYLPIDIEFSPDGTAFFPDYNNHRIRKIDPNTDEVTTISGTGFLGDGPNDLGSVTNCWSWGTTQGCDATKSAWNHPTAAVQNPNDPDEIWVAAWHNSRIDKIVMSTNKMYWYAGTGSRFYVNPATDDANGDGFMDGDVDQNGTILNEIQMDLPSSLAFAPDGSLYFSDQANHLIRRIDLSTDTISDIAGTSRHAGYDPDDSVGPTGSYLHGHTDQKADPGSKILISGDTLYLADTVNGVIRTIDLDSGEIDVYAGKYTSAGTTTYTDAITGATYDADAGSVPGYTDGPADQAVFDLPRDIAMGIDGELYVAEPKSNCVRVISPDGVVSTFAGQCVVGGEGDFAGDEGPATEATLNDPFGVAVDPEGNVYIADTNNQVIRRVKH